MTRLRDWFLLALLACLCFAYTRQCNASDVRPVVSDVDEDAQVDDAATQVGKNIRGPERLRTVKPSEQSTAQNQ